MSLVLAGDNHFSILFGLVCVGFVLPFILLYLNVSLIFFCCIWFGTMSWRLYESKKHYEYNYWSHVKLNWGMVWVWLTSRKVDTEEIEFEQKVNPSWQCVFNNMCAGLR